MDCFIAERLHSSVCVCMRVYVCSCVHERVYTYLVEKLVQGCRGLLHRLWQSMHSVPAQAAS
jgi:hypothetical protein